MGLADIYMGAEFCTEGFVVYVVVRIEIAIFYYSITNINILLL